MLKKSILMSLSLCVFLTPMTQALANNSTPSTASTPSTPDKKPLEKHSIQFEDGVYEVIKTEQADGSIKAEVYSPEGDKESFKIANEVIYDENGEVLAHLEREFTGNFLDQVVPYAYHNSDKSPYPNSDYSKYQGTETGNLQLTKNIQSFTVGALALLISVVAPAVGTIISAGLLAQAIEYNINAYAIFYEKKKWYHKTLGQLAQEIFVQMYWDPQLTKKAGPQEIYFRLYS